ncbi:MAG: alpha/beta hydrolase fold domain-containing protein [Terriglobia bacterium]
MKFSEARLPVIHCHQPVLVTLALVAAMALCPAPTLPQSSGCAVPVYAGPSYIIAGALNGMAYRPGLTLDAYAPQGPPRPAAIVIHGSHGNSQTHIDQLLEVLTHADYAWFSVNYHTAQDVAAAIDYVRCPGRFNITRHVILAGAGTGAAIALSLASSHHVQGVVTFGARFRSTAGVGSPQLASTALPSCRVLMFHGTKDDESSPGPIEALCKNMKACVFVPVPGAIHEFENWHPDQWQWKAQLTAWLRGDRRGLWKGIVYSRPGGRPLRMDAFVPEGKGPFPAVIIMHGGGWEAGDKVTYVSPVFEPLAHAGFAWFSIDYRLTPYVRVPDQLQDLRAAIRFVREHAAWFHVDPGRLAILGESASGHLVAQVASKPCNGCSVQAVVSFYGVYDFTRWTQRPGSQDSLNRLFGSWTPQTLQEYSPIDHVSRAMPPVLLIQGTGDELYQGTLSYAQRLKQAHVRYDLVLLKGAPHGMENWEGHQEWAFYKQRLVQWLRATLRR